MKKEKALKLQLINLLSKEDVRIESYDIERESIDVSSMQIPYKEYMYNGRARYSIGIYDPDMVETIKEEKTPPLLERKHFEIDKALLYVEEGTIPIAVALNGILWIEEPDVEHGGLGGWGGTLPVPYFYTNGSALTISSKDLYTITFYLKDGACLIGQAYLNAETLDNNLLIGQGALTLKETKETKDNLKERFV